MIVLICPAFFDAKQARSHICCFLHTKAAPRACTLISSRSLSALAYVTSVLLQPCFSDSFRYQFCLFLRSHLQFFFAGLHSSWALRSTPQHSFDVPWMLSYHVPKAATTLYTSVPLETLRHSHTKRSLLLLSLTQLTFLLSSAFQAVGCSDVRWSSLSFSAHTSNVV